MFEFFAAIGIPICEVWGMSELSSDRHDRARRIRSATAPWARRSPGVELRLADDGEVLVRGGTVMAGYRNQPEKTAETIDADGWLRTRRHRPDRRAGFLKIIDRKKELIINAAGKNMSPANIEQQLKQGSPLIGQAIAIGDRRPYNVALIVLDPDACAAFAARHGPVRLLARGDGRRAGGAGRGRRGRGARQLAPEPGRADQALQGAASDWPPGGDELTPTMKLRRKPIAAKYADEIEALYA